MLPVDFRLSRQSLDCELRIPCNYSLLVLFNIKFLGLLKIAFGWNGPVHWFLGSVH